MPGMQGIEVLQKIRHDMGDITTPIIMLTALGQDDIMQKAKEQGVTDFIVKGKVSPNDIIVKIKSLLNNK
jgi:CheY-like chemotaxis protein